jgi:hypothetical protein
LPLLDRKKDLAHGLVGALGQGQLADGGRARREIGAFDGESRHPTRRASDAEADPRVVPCESERGNLVARGRDRRVAGRGPRNDERLALRLEGEPVPLAEENHEEIRFVASPG